MGPGSLAGPETFPDFDWDVAPVPLGPAGCYTTFGSNWYGVYSKTRHPEAAAEFAKYLVGGEQNFHEPCWDRSSHIAYDVRRLHAWRPATEES